MKRRQRSFFVYIEIWDSGTGGGCFSTKQPQGYMGQGEVCFSTKQPQGMVSYCFFFNEWIGDEVVCFLFFFFSHPRPGGGVDT